ncbi:unnamed protein product [Soboliphyme baturini]|uniref:SUN domain-containing protein n=1 Tax=Soboliphyme baturini TaxID=241478 RepID=A0A3P8AZ47_9BILA|nr:unnamed protein product [Soboliphyme baturini]
MVSCGAVCLSTDTRYEHRRISGLQTPVVNEESSSVPLATRNYATKDCGAKILSSNTEAQNPSAVLKEKERDEYMLNPCSVEAKWIVIELCETVQITNVQLANFELFSSNPNEFRVSISERYPATEWKGLGEFTAEDNRQIQAFAMPQTKYYTKYIRIDFLTHHGVEHFCTVSLIRIFGISMIEEYEADAIQHEQQAVVVTPLSDVAVESKLYVVPQLLSFAVEFFAFLTVFCSEFLADCLPIGTMRRILHFTASRPKEHLNSKYFHPAAVGTVPILSKNSTENEKQHEKLKRTFAATNVNNNRIHSEIFGSLPGIATSAKESVFFRLNNRIRSLEINISLSSQYLRELSRNYKRQIEDIQRSLNRTNFALASTERRIDVLFEISNLTSCDAWPGRALLVRVVCSRNAEVRFWKLDEALSDYCASLSLNAFLLFIVSLALSFALSTLHGTFFVC